jgi:hypothetical protein
VVRLNGSDARESMDALPSRLQEGDTVRLRLRGEGGEREVVVVAEARPATRFSLIRPGMGEELIIVNGDSMHMPLRVRIDSMRVPLQALTVRIDSLRTELMDLEGANFRVEMDSLVRVLTDSAGVWQQRMPRVEFHRGEPMEIRENVIVDRMPFEDGRPFFMELGRRSAAGAELAEMNEGLSRYFGGQREGALVIEVSPESPAARAGLQPGDVIVRAGGQEVEDPADVRDALNRAEAGQVALEVIRQGQRRELSLEWTGDRMFRSEMGPTRELIRTREPVRVRERERVRTRPPEN